MITLIPLSARRFLDLDLDLSLNRCVQGPGRGIERNGKGTKTKIEIEPGRETVTSEVPRVDIET
jgi:hypothetical protein